jgi:hypothetical protein
MLLSDNGKRYEQLTELDFDRFRLASRALRRDYGLRIHGTLFDVRSRNHSIVILPRFAGGKKDSLFNSFVVGFFLAGLFYGGVHLVVWNRPFHGEIDALIWMSSSIIILVSGIPVVILYSADDFAFNNYDLRSMRDTARDLAKEISRLFFLMFLVLFLCLYIFARVLIIVECFLDVFHLPDSAFEVPRWSQYFPHIG